MMKQAIKVVTVVLFTLAIFLSCRKTDVLKIDTPPIAKAGPDQVITLPTDSILLDGSKSNDPDGKITGWLWTRVKDTSSSPATIVQANDSITKVNGLIAGVYKFELTVTDNGGLMARDTVQVTINNPNSPPVANAGRDTTITLPANIANLDGSGSTDPYNKISTYQWTKINGPTSFSITHADSAKTQVTNLFEGVYQFELKVTDAYGLFGKDTVTVTVNDFYDVYVAGFRYIGTASVATYWKNGQVISLTDGTKNASASSITVVGSDVYVAGIDDETAKYWKNEQPIALSDSTISEASANSIAVAGSDVYVAGREQRSPWPYPEAKYWKNGQSIALTDGIRNATANSILVVGSDVYVAGREDYYGGHYGGASIAKYWKNGQPIALTDSTHVAWISSIAVVGSDVYVAGTDNETAKYWKNGQAIALGDGVNSSYANSIAVIGSDVYVAGYELGNPFYLAKYWKNGQAVALSDGTKSAYAYSITVVGSDVYVAGVDGAVAKYWKNGQSIALTDGSIEASAASIFVKKQ
jgi:hypothetical protein